MIRFHTGNLKREAPFKVKVSFSRVFQHWEELLTSSNPIEAERSGKILAQLSHATALREPFEDLTLLEKYEHEIELLLSGLFSEALQANEIRTITLGFDQVFFNPTRRFRNIISRAGEGYVFGLRGLSDDDFYLMACFNILQAGFGVQINISKPQLIDIYDSEAGITRTYRGFVNLDFSEVVFTDKSPRLSPDQINVLLDNVGNIDLWKEHIPPQSFELHGFGILTLFDVSSDDAISKLKNTLIKKDALIDSEHSHALQDNLRRLLKIDDLQIGFSSYAEGEFYSIKSEGSSGMLMADLDIAGRDRIFCMNSYNTVFKRNQSLAFSNIDLLTHISSPLLDHIRKTGVKSYFITPLTYNGEVIGFLELGSKKPYALNSITKSNLEEIIPLFSTALKRSIDEFYYRINAVIKDKCTAIHRSVDWRFVQAASRFLKNRDNQNSKEIDMEDIVFEKVVPLYGQMDIRGSSKIRNDAIRDDLKTQLQLIKKVLNEAKIKKGLIFYDQLSHVVDKNLYKIEESIDAGDETNVLNFIHDKIDPVLSYLEDQELEISALGKYRRRIDRKLNMIYEKRKDYEQSVTLINDRIAGYLEEAQNLAQEIFPHYFERYKTDGIEYNLYVGQSLVYQQEYHPVYLHNLRIWQLMVTCDIELMLHELLPKLKVPLEIASLILVQDQPLDIKFRMDEKQFDVDGAYNVRYEILKKRLDKARVKGSQTRLTEPGKIAIVYSTEAEKRIYEEYLDFLIARSYILPSIEYLYLEEMEGVVGLQALRVDINFDRQPDAVKDQEMMQSLLQTRGH